MAVAPEGGVRRFQKAASGNRGSEGALVFPPKLSTNAPTLGFQASSQMRACTSLARARQCFGLRPSELATFVSDAGLASSDLTGADVGDALVEGVVPAPATAALLALGGLAATRRRR